MYDIVIRNGTLVDGSGAVGRLSDVAIKAGRIVAVGQDIEGPGDREIDATGLLVTPCWQHLALPPAAAARLRNRRRPRLTHGVQTALNCRT